MKPENAYGIMLEPEGMVYQHLLGFCLKRCDRAQLIVRKYDDLTMQGVDFVNCLKTHDIKIQEVKEWPGTALPKGVAQAYNFRVTPAAIRLLVEFTEGLYSWLEPELPEDLAFFRIGSGKVFLGSITREKKAFLNLFEDEVIDIQEQVEGLIIQES